MTEHRAGSGQTFLFLGLTAWLVALACAGCGRLGFDLYGQEDGGTSGPEDGGLDPGVGPDARPGSTGDGGAVPAGPSQLLPLGGAGIDETYDVAVDVAGNVYVTGAFEQTVDFGGGPVTAVGASDMYLASLTRDGKPRWVRTLGSTQSETVGLALDVNAAGDVYVTGWFTGNLDRTQFGGGVEPSAGGQDAFLAAYTSNGEPKSLVRYGGFGDEAGRGLDADDSGNTYVVGWFSDKLDFGNGQGHDAISGQDTYLASFDASGVHRWSMAVDATFWAVAGDDKGTIYVAGDFQGTADFGTGNLTSVGGSIDVVVMSYGSTGAPLWVEQYGGAEDQVGFGIAVDASGNVAVAGGFSKTANFGGETFTTPGLDGGYMMSLKPDGTHRWSQAWGGAGYTEAWGMGASDTGEVYAVGYLGYGTVMFGPTVVDLPTTGVFVYSFSAADGAARELVILDSAGEDFGYGGAASGPGIYAVGAFEGTFELGDSSVTSQYVDGFLVTLP